MKVSLQGGGAGDLIRQFDIGLAKRTEFNLDRIILHMTQR